METSYGSIILKKGIILYNLNDDKDIDLYHLEFNMYFDKKLLFCVFHPSEANITNKYVHYIKLKKNLKLLFMIEGFNGIKIQSFFKFFTDLEYNSIKTFNFHNKNILENYIKKLKDENFDGWITSIDNTNNLEISIINDYNNFKIIKSSRLKIDWINRHIKNTLFSGEQNSKENTMNLSKNTIDKELFSRTLVEENIENKYWGENYKVDFINFPIEIKLNYRYKKMINKYKKNALKKKYILDNTFQLLLEYSIITYHKGNMKRVIWY